MKKYTQSELELISIWTDVLEGSEYPWVLFSFGTCVVLERPKTDIEEQAKDLMRKWAEPIAGTPSFKFGVSFLSKQGIPGCIVSCHHPNIMTFVSPEESPIETLPDFKGVRTVVGSLGRKKRLMDYHALNIIHTQQNRVR